MDGFVALTTTWFVAGLWFAAFLIGVVIDRRRLRNGVYLVVGLGFLGIGGLISIEAASPGTTRPLLLLAVLACALLVVGLAVFLILNGIVMLAKEGRGLANLLSLLLGLGIAGFLLLVFFMLGSQVPMLGIVLGSMAAVLGYFSFVFVCFLLYSAVYGRIKHRRNMDFIVVLGAGLVDGQVPRVLGERLNRACGVYDSLVAGGEEPMIVTAGWPGPGGGTSEARAMADYLIAKGVSEDRILLEDKSKTTLENLRFSREIMVARKADYRCVVVTSNYHVLRAAVFCRRAKVNGQVVGSRTARYFWPSAVLREFVAILVDNKVKNGILCALFAVLGPMTLFALKLNIS